MKRGAALTAAVALALVSAVGCGTDSPNDVATGPFVDYRTTLSEAERQRIADLDALRAVDVCGNVDPAAVTSVLSAPSYIGPFAEMSLNKCHFTIDPRKNQVGIDDLSVAFTDAPERPMNTDVAGQPALVTTDSTGCQVRITSAAGPIGFEAAGSEVTSPSKACDPLRAVIGASLARIQSKQPPPTATVTTPASRVDPCTALNRLLPTTPMAAPDLGSPVLTPQPVEPRADLSQCFITIGPDPKNAALARVSLGVIDELTDEPPSKLATGRATFDGVPARVDDLAGMCTVTAFPDPKRRIPLPTVTGAGREELITKLTISAPRCDQARLMALALIESYRALT